MNEAVIWNKNNKIKEIKTKENQKKTEKGGKAWVE